MSFAGGQLTVQLDPGRSPRMKFQLNDMATITSPVDIATSFRRPARFNIYLIKDEVADLFTSILSLLYDCLITVSGVARGVKGAADPQ